jgi:DNA repair protein RadA/Sms
MTEDAVDKKAFDQIQVKSIEISKVSLEDAFQKRILTGIDEFDRVLGNGIVHDGILLLSGDPGIGKSTLALQAALMLAGKGMNVLYVSGEESVSQVSLRARRLFKNGVPPTFSLLSSNHLESIVATIKKAKPQFVVADSVQTFLSEEVSGVSGSIVQTRHIAEAFMYLAKQHQIPVLLIGHVNKDGDLAGPKVLEHLVDTVLYLEGEKYHELRILRAMKNRFGSTTEVGIFSMDEDGLQEVKNPSEVFLRGRKKNVVGSAISVTLEGTRPFVVEVQALTSRADFTYPKRTASGIDLNRLQLLTAVLNKHAKLKLDDQDVYLNIAGGFRVKDPALDLAIAAAIISSRKDISLPEGIGFIGEIGLSGEIRPVSQEERRMKELQKLGFKEIWGNIQTKKSDLHATFIDDMAGLMRLIVK